MNVRRVLSAMLALTFCAGCIWLGNARTVKPDTAELSEFRQFSQLLQADQYWMMRPAFSLKAGERVRIYAMYQPDERMSHGMDYGLYAPDGNFYYCVVNHEELDQTLYVPQDGIYRLVIHNRSNSKVKTMGTVAYKPGCLLEFP